MKKPRNSLQLFEAKAGLITLLRTRETDMSMLARPRAPTRSEKSTHSTKQQQKTVSNAGDAARATRSVAGAAPQFSGGLLGIDAKYSARTPKTDPDTGEITGLDGPYNPMLARVQRFMLQSVVRKFLPKSRTNNCLRVRQGSKQIQVWKSIEHGTTAYAGLQTCGSVWVCPVCSAKIAERRRAEIAAAMAAHRAQAGWVNLLTLTCPHQRTDKLRELLAKQALALKYLFQDKTTRKLFAEMGVIGQIRALEATHGRLSDFNNGWHPHYHFLLFGGVGVDLKADDALRRDWAVRLYLRWSVCCVRAGLGNPSFEHGLKLDDGEKAGAYVAKWGLEDEMTKGHTKKAKHGETPFDLLRAYLLDAKDKVAAALFIEFAETFKGKRQLHWSSGLKKRFAIGESTDDELAAQQEDYARLLGTITLEQWRDVLRVEGRAIVLQLAVQGWDAVTLYLDSIRVPDK